MKRTGKKQSTIFRYVRFITDYFYHIIRQSVFGRVFSSYDTLNIRHRQRQNAPYRAAECCRRDGEQCRGTGALPPA